MRIYFGRVPDEYVLLDIYFIPLFIKENYSISKAVDRLMVELNSNLIYYTVNPLILNYLSETEDLDKVYFIDSTGKHICIAEDSITTTKLTWAGIGEALCDDSRCFND